MSSLSRQTYLEPRGQWVGLTIDIKTIMTGQVRAKCQVSQKKDLCLIYELQFKLVNLAAYYLLTAVFSFGPKGEEMGF